MGNVRNAFVVAALGATAAFGQTVHVTVRADRPAHRVSRYLTGACIEDVNHEIYGGIFSQMVFGESFEEPDPAPPLKGFVAFDGEWSAKDGVLRGSGGSGPKLISELPAFKDGEVSVDVRLDGPGGGNAGLIVRAARSGRGADNFDGYEVSLDAARQVVRLGRHRVVVFEFNSGNHSQRRALANALAINALGRDGRVPIAASANCLQVDGQNDNGWNQGLLFLNPQKVWLQPPGYVTRMFSRNYQPLTVPAVVRGDAGALDVSAKRSEDHRTLVLQVVNANERDVDTEFELVGYTPSRAVALVEALAAPLGEFNTAQEPERVVPKRSEWAHGCSAGRVRRTFPPWSVTVIRLE